MLFVPFLKHMACNQKSHLSRNSTKTFDRVAGNKYGEKVQQEKQHTAGLSRCGHVGKCSQYFRPVAWTSFNKQVWECRDILSPLLLTEKVFIKLFQSKTGVCRLYSRVDAVYVMFTPQGNGRLYYSIPPPPPTPHE